MFDLASLVGIRITTIMGLIAADVIMGVALAMHKKEFSWKEFLRFYRTNVGPYLLGYLAFDILVKTVTPELLGEYKVIVEEATITAVWLYIVKSIGIDSFFVNAKELYKGLLDG